VVILIQELKFKGLTGLGINVIKSHNNKGGRMKDKQLVKRIIEMALKIKETDQLSKVAEELRTMEIEKMFTTKEGKYYTLNT